MIKVDRVFSRDEAIELQKLGVDIIGVSMTSSTSFEDNREVDLSIVKSIKEGLKKSKLAVELPSDFLDIKNILDQVKPDFIQFSSNTQLTDEVVNIIKSKDVAVIHSFITVSPDDDPSWILSNSLEEAKIPALYHQIDLFGDYENSWDFIQNKSPLYPDEIQVKDIVDLAIKYPLLISLDFNERNILEIIDCFKVAKGIYFCLSEKTNRNDLHCFTFPNTINVLKIIANSIS